MSAAAIFNTQPRWIGYGGKLRISSLVGGVPKDPDTIRAWLKARMQVGDAEIQAVTEETLEAMNWAQDEAPPIDELVDAVMERTAPKGNSFKRIDGQLVWEGRCLKAALVEACNVCFPGNQWPGKPNDIHAKKGLKSYFIERGEVVDTYLSLGRTQPDVIGEQRIKHTKGPQGARSVITVVDICQDVEVAFTVRVLDDCIRPEIWAALWQYVEMGGVGADRARGDGRCELVAWERLDRLEKAA